MVGEIGGRAEEDAAEWIMNYRKRTSNPKPIMGLIGGVKAPPGRIMGHAGAWAAPGEANAAEKVRILENAGVIMVEHPEEFGTGMKQLLELAKNTKNKTVHGAFQRRRLHTMRQRPRLRQDQERSVGQKRSMYIKQSQAIDILSKAGLESLTILQTEGNASWLCR